MSGKLKQYFPDFQIIRRQKKQIIDIKSKKIFELYGQEYELIERMSPGDWKISNVVTARQTNLSETDITDFLFKGDY